MRLAPPSPPGPVTDDSGRHRSTPPNAARGHVRVHAALAPHGSVHHAMPCHMPCQRDSDAPRSRPPPSLYSTPPVQTLAPAKLGRPCLVPDGSRPSRRRTGRRERWDWMKWSMPCNWPPAPSYQRPATSDQQTTFKPGMPPWHFTCWLCSGDRNPKSPSVLHRALPSPVNQDHRPNPACMCCCRCCLCGPSPRLPSCSISRRRCSQQ